MNGAEWSEWRLNGEQPHGQRSLAVYRGFRAPWQSQIGAARGLWTGFESPWRYSESPGATGAFSLAGLWM
jgi:hypothetical protein